MRIMRATHSVNGSGYRVGASTHDAGSGCIHLISQPGLISAASTVGAVCGQLRSSPDRRPTRHRDVAGEDYGAVADRRGRIAHQQAGVCSGAQRLRDGPARSRVANLHPSPLDESVAERGIGGNPDKDERYLWAA